jgi:hypothetical protein
MARINPTGYWPEQCSRSGARQFRGCLEFLLKGTDVEIDGPRAGVRAIPDWLGEILVGGEVASERIAGITDDALQPEDGCIYN